MTQEAQQEQRSLGMRVFLIAAGAAFGLATAAALVAVALLSWHSRPTPWDSKGITAVFDSVDTEGEKRTLLFFYTVQNHTDRDYRVEGGTDVTIAFRLKDDGRLSPDTRGEILTAEFPFFIPAREKILYRLHLGEPYPSAKSLPSDKKARGLRLRPTFGTSFQTLTGSYSSMPPSVGR